MEKNYCFKCGMKLSTIEQFPLVYNEEIGEPILVKECMNTNCYFGKINSCKRTGGHERKHFFSNRCKKMWIVGE